MTIARQVTPAFPATFLRAGNADPFTASNSVPLAAALIGLGIDVDARIVGEPDHPARHEYQFALGSSAADQTVQELVGFLRRVMA